MKSSLPETPLKTRRRHAAHRTSDLGSFVIGASLGAFFTFVSQTIFDQRRPSIPDALERSRWGHSNDDRPVDLLESGMHESGWDVHPADINETDSRRPSRHV